MIPIKKFDERIYDPDLGEGVSSTQVARKYFQKEDAEDYFISFTRLEKIGINPLSNYNTPLGIYTYPLVEFFNEYIERGYNWEYKKLGEYAPFAGNNPYVNIIKKNDSNKFIDDIADRNIYTENDLEDDIESIINIVTNIEEFYIWRNNSISELFLKYEIDKVLKKPEILKNIMERLSDQARFNHLPGSRFWNITRVCSDLNSKKWNKLFRFLGYGGIADLGVGIIHPDEEIQAVFFSRKDFDLIERIENAEASSLKYDEIDDQLEDCIENYILNNKSIYCFRVLYNEIIEERGKRAGTFILAFKLADRYDHTLDKNFVKGIIFRVKYLVDDRENSIIEGWNEGLEKGNKEFSINLDEFKI